MEQNKNLDIEKRVRETIMRVFQLSPADAQGELRMNNPPQWDSLGHMQLIIELENDFGLTFPTYQIAELTNVDAIVREFETQRANEDAV
jgi:acyl carrier protein